MGAWLAVCGGILVAAAGFGLGTRWACEHIPGLRTFAMELSAERDACLDLRGRLRRQAREKVEPLEDWAVWRARIDAWDRPFWQLLERRLPDLWRVYRRENAIVLEDYGDRWPSEMLDLLEGRWQLIKRLSEREHGGG